MHIGLVEAYAGLLILEVRNRTANAAQRIPALEIADALSLKTYLGINPADRLPLFQERLAQALYYDFAGTSIRRWWCGWR